MKLKQLLKEIDYDFIQGNLNQFVSQIDYDSRTVQQDSLFVCIPGANVDGHDFINDVIQKGATTIIIEKDVPYQDGITYLQVEDARIALALLSCAFFDHPSRKMTVIGITGTKGKTTTSYMVESILNKAHKKVGIIGTIGSLINGELRKTKNTTPESFELQRLMNEMVENGCEYCVMEVSSQGLMLNRVAGIDFDYGVFTNLSPDHIGEHEHHSFEHYMACKKKLFQMCKIGIFNKDDSHYEEMINGVKCIKKTYSIEKDSDLQASHIHLCRGVGTLGVKFQTSGLVDGQFETDIPGNFSVYNSLVAIMICYLLHIDVPYIQEALKQVRVRGRVEIVPVEQKYTVMIDYAHNPLSFESILATIEEYKPHQIYCVYGAGGHRDVQRRYDVGEIVAKYQAFSVVTADNPRGEDIHKICQDIVTGIKRAEGDYVIIEDRQEAIHYALSHAQDGDVILCLGKGHEDYQIIDKEPLPFSEKEIIENYFQ
ncbi:UDP-N-acetylmuramoyl-L-alanyl-D-glutamate--2,6-diaminopimelate ligase [Candidatus Stoquefichus massiliensis]|uniref:UDP-N-acetylmuramoyl-L-alanyl-D-glutamate--2, 6-diaminopimelate ligase n=1 Tax=Candidatus Stoquefichus massiliensis TaxID=1470350 RepID=UPI00047FCA99|nr:UDP-N-acetylmuramoyl-L-alanyl-D-glutamate--2,6-diaminopimelate ligase [Candidatus Stoquefichus massiliensis]